MYYNYIINKQTNKSSHLDSRGGRMEIFPFTTLTFNKSLSLITLVIGRLEHPGLSDNPGVI